MSPSGWGSRDQLRPYFSARLEQARRHHYAIHAPQFFGHLGPWEAGKNSPADLLQFIDAARQAVQQAERTSRKGENPFDRIIDDRIVGIVGGTFDNGTQTQLIQLADARRVVFLTPQQMSRERFRDEDAFRDWVGRQASESWSGSGNKLIVFGERTGIRFSPRSAIPRPGTSTAGNKTSLSRGLILRSVGTAPKGERASCDQTNRR